MGQYGIMVFGLLAIFLVNLPHDNRWQRWGCVSGLCAQPFWFWTTYSLEQYGLLFLSLFYCASWMKGFYHQWLSN